APGAHVADVHSELERVAQNLVSATGRDAGEVLDLLVDAEQTIASVLIEPALPSDVFEALVDMRGAVAAYVRACQTLLDTGAAATATMLARGVQLVVTWPIFFANGVSRMTAP